MKDNAYLVVGGDSLVGGSILCALAKRGYRAYSTTRRVGTESQTRIFLDFESFRDFNPPRDVSFLFVAAAVATYERCERDPLSRKINVDLIPRFVEDQLRRGLFVMFISTNSVFGGEHPWPAEDDLHRPQIHYAKQKSEGEAVVCSLASDLGAQRRLAIVRLTKILTPETAPLPNWFSAWEKGQCAQPFEDLIFAPMSAQFAGSALVTLAEKRIAGNLHLSGADNVNYVFFARALAKAAGVSSTLVSPTSATSEGIKIAYKPTYSGLGMRRTTRLSGILPQTLESVVEDLMEARPGRRTLLR